MSETDDQTDDQTNEGEEHKPRVTDASQLSDQGLGATASKQPNTMEPEEALPDEDD